MAPIPTDWHRPQPLLRQLLATTRRDIADRIGDPYLTDHDRWVLGQFQVFLGGSTPGPDPRVTRPQSTTTLRRARLGRTV